MATIEEINEEYSIEDTYDEFASVPEKQVKPALERVNGKLKTFDANSGEPVLSNRNYVSEKSITGTVKHTYCQYDSFTAGILKAGSGPLLTRDCRFSVKSSVSIGDNITLKGKWVDGKYGWSFEATGVEYPMPNIESVKGLAEYLANEPAFRGIGPAKAQKIAITYGANLGEVLENNPEDIHEQCGVSPEFVEILKEQWVLRSAINAISVWLADYGLTAYQIRRIAAQYGNQAQAVLTDDPYKLIDDLDGFGFLKADTIALKMGIEKTSPLRIRRYIEYYLSELANNDGHTAVLKTNLIKQTIKNLYMDSTSSNRLIESIIDALVDEGKLCITIQLDGEYISLASLFWLERDLYQWLDKPLSVPEWPISPAVIEKIEQSERLTFEQKSAINKALNNRVSVVSGGAGTGKSYTIIKLLEILKSADLSYAVCAPTGKAARRLSDDGIDAKTIHRTLVYVPETGSFYHDKDNKLDVDFLIVDELSMCAVPILHSLLQAVDFNKTSVLLVGDYNQLPPIGPGNTLRDIIKYKLCPHTFLSICHRSQGDLYKNQNAILAGRFSHRSTKRDDGRFAWCCVEDRDDPQEVVDLCKLLVNEQLENWGYHPLKDCQIITPMNQKDLGTNRLNLELQRVWQAKRGNELPPVVKFDAKPKLYTGDKIMQTKNDYKADDNNGIMNGTTGIILNIMDNHYVIQFDDRDYVVQIEVGSKTANSFALAYACTIHKVQGSQYPCVVCIIHSTHSYMLSRNLLYTAVTRARESALVLGNSTGIRRAITRTDPQDRLTLTGLWAYNEIFADCEGKKHEA